MNNLLKLMLLSLHVFQNVGQYCAVLCRHGIPFRFVMRLKCVCVCVCVCVNLYSFFCGNYLEQRNCSFYCRKTFRLFPCLSSQPIVLSECTRIALQLWLCDCSA
jgi:hypothetical protein